MNRRTYYEAMTGPLPPTKDERIATLETEAARMHDAISERDRQIIETRRVLGAVLDSVRELDTACIGWRLQRTIDEADTFLRATEASE